MDDRHDVIARRWVKLLKQYTYGTGRGGCHRWSFDPSEACAFADEAAAHRWLAGTAAEVVPASELEASVPSFTAGSS